MHVATEFELLQHAADIYIYSILKRINTQVETITGWTHEHANISRMHVINIWTRNSCLAIHR